MKKTPLFIGIVVLLTISACTSNYNVIRSYNDRFKDTHSLVLRQKIRPSEWPAEVNLVDVTYERLMEKSKEKANLYFVFYRGTNSFNIDRKGYMSVDGKKFEIEAINMQTEFKSQVNSSSTTSTTVDSSGVHTTMANSSSTENWINDKFRVELTPEMIQALKNDYAGNLAIRFYSGPTPVTINVFGNMRKKLNELMTSTI